MQISVTILSAYRALVHMLDFHPECTDGDVRLIEGEADNSGKVQFCRSGRWGIVCLDFWDNNDATVACRQLGYNVEGERVHGSNQNHPIFHAFTILYTDGNVQVIAVSLSANFLVSLDQIDCKGNESMLSQCPHSDTVCIRPGAGVICPILIATTSLTPETTHTPEESSHTTQTEPVPDRTETATQQESTSPTSTLTESHPVTTYTTETVSTQIPTTDSSGTNQEMVSYAFSTSLDESTTQYVQDETNQEMGLSATSTSLDESTTQYVTTAQDETNQEMGSSTVSTSLDESTTQYITTVQDETSQEIVLPTTSTSLDEFTTQYVQDETTETKSGS